MSGAWWQSISLAFKSYFALFSQSLLFHSQHKQKKVMAVLCLPLFLLFGFWRKVYSLWLWCLFPFHYGALGCADFFPSPKLWWFSPLLLLKEFLNFCAHKYRHWNMIGLGSFHCFNTGNYNRAVANLLGLHLPAMEINIYTLFKLLPALIVLLVLPFPP